MENGAGCGICGMPPQLGTFQGQHTDDAPPGHDAWRWHFEAGQILFSTEPLIVLDDSEPIEYCGSCEQDMREDRGLSPNTPIYVNLLYK